MEWPVLRGAAVVLRRPQPHDGVARFALGNDAGIMRMFGADPAGWPPLSQKRAARWAQDLAAHPHAWVVEHEGQFLGEIRLDGLNPQDTRARLAIGLYDPAKLGMGLGRDAIRLVLAHAFGLLRLHRVGLRVIAFNTRAIRCYRACGFIEEGREREAARVGGAWHDDIMMGVLAQEFVHNDGLCDALPAARSQPA